MGASVKKIDEMRWKKDGQNRDNGGALWQIRPNGFHTDQPAEQLT